MADPFDELTELSPEERIRKLKEIEDKNKAEIEKAEELIKESKQEIKREHEKLEKIPIPQLKAVDVDSLFSAEEKQIFETKRFARTRRPAGVQGQKPGKDGQKRLEEMAREAPVLSEEQINAQKEYFSKQPTKVLYETVAGIYNEVKAQEREMTEEEKAAAYQIDQEMDKRAEMIETGTYKGTGEDVQDMLDIGKNIIKTLYRK
ncbi:hypothetical protein GF351_02610 [Candidatus Woesearchaeota archaeon]|nr:hypothetical protein [Candidatus Woesearchaeota archaeon]